MNPFNSGLINMAGAMLTPGGGLGQGFTAFNQGLGQGIQMDMMRQKSAAYQRQTQLAEQEAARNQQLQEQQAAVRQQIAAAMGLGGRGQAPVGGGAQQPSVVPMPDMPDPAGLRPVPMPDAPNTGGLPAVPMPDPAERAEWIGRAGDFSPEQRQRLASLMALNGYKAPEINAVLGAGRFGEKDPIKLGQGDVLVDPNSYKEVFKNEKPVDWNQLIVSGPDGKPMVNQMLLDAQLQKARAGAAQTNLTVNAGKDLASQVGEMMKGERTGVEGALRLASSADSLEQALDSGRVIAGPGASVKINLLQLGQTLGISGKTTEETLTNTRQAIRALAQMDVQARRQLEGQGQVTESEARAVAKAEGGNIDEMTIPELRLLVGLTRKVTAFKAQQYQSRLQSVPAELRPFYELPGLDRYTNPPKQAPGAPVGQPGMPSQDAIAAEIRRREELRRQGQR